MIGEGTRLAGRYEVRSRLGGGSAGEVWLAHDDALERLVAIKVLRHSDGEDQRRFTDEIRAQAPLAHHAIVRVFDAGCHEDVPFLVMAYVDGRPLSSLLLQGPLSAERVGRLGRQLAEALAHAHSHGVIHRDVKPGNVLVADDGQAYLTDFGIARHQSSDRVTASRPMPLPLRCMSGSRPMPLPLRCMSGSRPFVVSAAYAAPEQLSGTAASAAVDVYALGLVLLEAFTGSREHPGTAIESATARLYRPPRVSADLPRPWPQLLTHMTAADPADRFTAAEVAARLAGRRAVEPDPEATARLVGPGDSGWEATMPLSARTSGVAASSGQPSPAGEPASMEEALQRLEGSVGP